MPEDNKINVNINYELTGNLPECIHDTEFIVEMYKNKGFTIDEHDFTFMKKLETTLCEEQIKSLTFNLKKVNYHRQSRWLWFAINGLPQTAASRVATPPIVISKCRPLCGLHSPDSECTAVSRTRLSRPC